MKKIIASFVVAIGMVATFPVSANAAETAIPTKAEVTVNTTEAVNTADTNETDVCCCWICGRYRIYRCGVCVGWGYIRCCR